MKDQLHPEQAEQLPLQPPDAPPPGLRTEESSAFTWFIMAVNRFNPYAF